MRMNIFTAVFALIFVVSAGFIITKELSTPKEQREAVRMPPVPTETPWSPDKNIVTVGEPVTLATSGTCYVAIKIVSQDAVYNTQATSCEMAPGTEVSVTELHMQRTNAQISPPPLLIARKK